MPIVKPGSKVLVSCLGSPFFSCWLIKTLLERGYSVRGTVWSEDQKPHLEKLFEKYVAEGKFELVVIDDITKDGAFDEAVKGVDAIQHRPYSSPDDSDPNASFPVPVNATVGLLKSAATFGTSVKRVVLTSSMAAVITEPPLDSDSIHYFSEKDWNEHAVKVVEEKGKDAPGSMKYRASQTLAERGAWKFMDENKGKLSFDLTTFTPPVANPWRKRSAAIAIPIKVSSSSSQPPINEIASAENLSSSVKLFYQVVVNGLDPKSIRLQSGSWIDVRDLAHEQVVSMEMEEARGERFVVSAGNWTFQDFFDVANSLVPSPIPSHPNLPKGTPGSGKEFVHRIKLVNEKEERVFKFKKRTMEETTRDMLAYFEERGW